MPLDIDPEKSKVILIGTGYFDNDKDFQNIPPVKGNLEDLGKFFSEVIGIQKCKVFDNPSLDTPRLLNQAAKETTDTLIVYYTGHGHRKSNRELFLTIKESERDTIDISAIDFKKFLIAINHAPAQKKILILDCCYSGIAAMSSEESFEQAAGIQDVKGTYVLASSLSNKVSEFDPEHRHTFFTGALLKVLQEGIENGKEFLDIDEVFFQVKKNLKEKNLPEPTRKTTLNFSKLHIAPNAKYSKSNYAFKSPELKTSGASNGLADFKNTLKNLYQNDLTGFAGVLAKPNTMQNPLLKNLNQQIKNAFELQSTYIEKKKFFSDALAYSSSAAERFSLQKKIEEIDKEIEKCEKEIQRLLNQ